MNEKMNIVPRSVRDESHIDRQNAVEVDGLAIRRKIVIICVGIEFVAIFAAFIGVTPTVFWVAIGASTMSAFFAFVLAWKVYPLPGMALPTLNALSCYRLWSVPWMISDGGLSKYLFIAVLLMRMIGWVSLLIINRRARSFLETRFSAENGRT